MRRSDLIPAIVALLSLFALMLRFWRLGDMPLFADEAYYLLWAQRPAPAYFDHPAGVALLLRLSTMLDRGEFGVRWLNAVLSTACVPLSYVVGRAYLHRVGGLMAAAVVAVAPVYVLTGRVVYPDALQCVLLLLNLLALSPVLLRRERLWHWVWIGLTLALLLNVKLSSAFYGAALALYVLLWRRELLHRRGFWLAAVIALLGITPLIGWNVAHGWAGVRWALLQGQGFGLAPPGLFARLVHAVGYHTTPAALLAVVSAAAYVVNLRRSGETQHVPTAGTGPDDEAGSGVPAQGAKGMAGLLVVVAAFLLAPVLFSAADNPRNLGIGLLPLWPLAGALFVARQPLGRVVLVLGLLGWLAVCGAGSAAALLGSTTLPRSTAAPAIRADAAPWPSFARGFSPPPGSLIYAVDYSIAGQVSYYTGQPAFSSGGQFRIWGIPEASDMTVLSQGYIPPAIITDRLSAAFARLEGPHAWEYSGGEVQKTVLIWQAQGRRVPMARVIEDLDYLSLAQEAGGALR